jgi:hypothetical protein
MLRLVYKPAGADREEPLPKALLAPAKIASEVLHYCHCQPGTQPDGTIDRDAFMGFIDESRRLCRQADRLKFCDLKLGGILAHSPADANGTWPFEPACEVLDRADCEDIRRGFQTECWNKRGVTQKASDEGGEQERMLAETYRRHARIVCTSHPRLAAAIDQLASSYEQYGRREDRDADLRRESY